MTNNNLLRYFIAICFCFASHTAFASDPAADFTLNSSKGAIKLSDLKGKVVLLDFWASWCGPCRESFSWMQKMHSKYDKQGLTIVAVNVDKDSKLASAFLKQHPADFTIAYDPEGKVAEAYSLVGMPSSFLIDDQGKIQEQYIGFHDGDAQVNEERIKAMLKNIQAGHK
jgi:peroxiredoxin